MESPICANLRAVDHRAGDPPAQRAATRSGRGAAGWGETTSGRPDAQAAAAARQFESIFTQTLFKGMRQANQVLTQDNPMSSSYTQFYEGMLDERKFTVRMPDGSEKTVLYKGKKINVKF